MRIVLFVFSLLFASPTWATKLFKSDTTKVRLGYKNSVGMGVRWVSGLENLNKNLNSIGYPE
jgi:hypothetical protein